MLHRLHHDHEGFQVTCFKLATSNSDTNKTRNNGSVAMPGLQTP